MLFVTSVMSVSAIRCIRVLGKSAQLLKSATEKRDPKKTSSTFGCNLRAKVCEQNFATESRCKPSSLGKCQGYHKQA